MILLATDVFVPDGDEARRWAEDELAKQAYQAAKPTWFDQLSQSIVEFIADLFTAGPSTAAAPFATVLIVIVLLAAVVVALVVWGRPRASRSARRRTDLLGERDDRTAAQLRAEADRAAREGDWDAAVVLRYRAIARSLLERDLIAPAPGATAQAIAREAAAVFPGEATALASAASTFDRVRYLRLPASADDDGELKATDDRLAATSPAAAPQSGAVPA